jgi:AsmA protein
MPSLSRAPRLILLGALALLAFVAIALLGSIALLDPNAHKARVEGTASQVLGLDVRVDGPMQLRFGPGVRLLLQDVHARKGDADVVAARQVVLHVGWRSLLSGNPQAHRIELHDGSLAVARGRDGRFNFQKDHVPGEQPPERVGPDIVFSGFALTVADSRWDGGPVQARGCRGEVSGLHIDAGPRTSMMAALTLRGDFGCAEVGVGDLTATDVQLSADAKGGVLQLDPVRAQLFGAAGSGRVRADYTGAAAAYRVEHTLRQFPVEQLLQALSLKPVATGRLDLSVTLSMQGSAAHDLQRSMQGTVSLRGQGLTYLGADLDAQFERFESSQTFDLFDVGAMLLVGPAGLLITKGYDFASAARGSQGRSEIRALVSDWRVERGSARAEDVALATAHNRVALRGTIDLPSGQLADLTLALLDAKGCAKAQQAVHGTLRKPVVDRPNPIAALAGPAVRLLQKGAEALAGDRCDVFYAGTVASPK